MAWENGLMDLGQIASSGDMTGNQYKAVALSTANGEMGAAVVATRGGPVHGVWQDNSTVATAGAIRVHGVSKILAGDSSGMENAITLGTKLVASSQGHAVPSTAAGQQLIGIAYGSLSTGSTGIIPVLLTLGAISS